MSLRSLWRQIGSKLTARKSVKPPRFRPSLELLERRYVPALIINDPGSQISNEGAEISLTITATDTSPGENDWVEVTLVPESSQLPPGLEWDTSSEGLLIHGTVDYSAASLANPTTQYSIVVRAQSPGDENVFLTVNWTVVNVNRAPEITSFGNPEDWWFTQGQEVSILITANDPDGDTLSWSAFNLPPGLSIAWYDATSALVSGTVLPHDEEGPEKLFPVELEVSDGEDDGDVFVQARNFTIRVTSITIAGPAQVGAGGEEYTISINLAGVTNYPQQFIWDVWHDAPGLDVRLKNIESPWVSSPTATGQTTYTVTRTIVLRRDANGNVEGPNGSSGTPNARVFVRTMAPGAGINWRYAYSNTLDVTAAP